MILQPLDIKNNCQGIFYNGEFVFEELQGLVDNCSFAWKYTPTIGDRYKNYTFGYLLAKGADLKCYSPNKEEYIDSENRILSHQKSCLLAKVNLENNCFYDVVPEFQLTDHFLQKLTSLQVLQKLQRQEDYDILEKAHILSETISRQELNIKNSNERYVKYNIFGTSTGRFSTLKGSYPILTARKESRKNIMPQNDMFLELDLNGAEIRTLLSFSGEKQPTYDIHEFNKKNASKGSITREEAKEKFFAWLYNPNAKDQKLEKIYNKDVYEQYYTDGVIKTPFGRKIEVDEKKALNYLIQSTTSDIVVENAFRILEILKDKKSFISFSLHDAIIIDFSKEDYKLVKQIKDTFENTRMGKYMSNIKIGIDFGNMIEVNL